MSNANMPAQKSHPKTPVDWVIWLCLHNKLLVGIGLLFFVGWGLSVAPFNWELDMLPRDPVPVDAIPDLGENQQIVFTEWEGRSPQDVEDQISYPLTVALLGVPGVKTVRSVSMFGFSSINVIFEDNIEFYWSRSRILEKLNSLPPALLPDGVSPALGPDATALGQVYWYTLEGRDPEGNPVGGWSPQELRSIQDFTVRYALASADGVSEVASIGGFVQEYQVDVDPDAMRAADIMLEDVFSAVKNSNVDVGARTIEINRVEYIIRGLGFLESVEDLENTVIFSRDNIPIYIKDIAKVSLGPALRTGALDKSGAEAVGGVVLIRNGVNPLQTINGVKAKIQEISAGLPTRVHIDYGEVTAQEVESFADSHAIDAFVDMQLNHDGWLAWMRNTPKQEWPDWLTTSQVNVVPFYDRTGLIRETIGTLETAIFLQILVTMLVVIIMVMHLRSSLLISTTLPLAVLLSFIAMKQFNVTANIVALSGIAIAIGTVVDMGIILCENILRRLDEAPPEADSLDVIYEASSEVGGAVLTAIATTIVGFLPVFTMSGAEGKLFGPLAYTKTFALLASVLIALTVLPTLASVLLSPRKYNPRLKTAGYILLGIIGIVVAAKIALWAGVLIMVVALYQLVQPYLPKHLRTVLLWSSNLVIALLVAVALSEAWLPLGPQAGFWTNALFVVALVGGLLLFFRVFLAVYPYLLRFFLNHKLLYLSIPAVVVLFGAFVWLGAGNVLSFLPNSLKSNAMYSSLYHRFPGLGKEFMPPLDEGAFLYMPTTMPHASIGEALDVVQKQDMAFTAIPEVDTVVGKIGRVESPLDPAPYSMLETLINYKPEYKLDENGRRLRFRFDDVNKEYAKDDQGNLIPDPNGIPFRQWRSHIQTPEDIWQEILKAGELPGTTSAPKLQPIMTRIIMLQSGMRSPMGIKVRGPNLETIEQVSMQLEQFLKEVQGVSAPTVYAERIVGKPYLEIDIDRKRIARYGVSIRNVQDVIEVAIGGQTLTTTVEGRERYPVRVRYQRELRDSIEALERILISTKDGVQVPLIQVADIHYVRGPMSIKSEDTFLVGYVTFDKLDGFAEVDVVESCQKLLNDKLANGEWSLPAGVSYAFAGNYENQLRAQKTLAIVLPLALLAIFVLLYLQFRSTSTTLFVFIGIGVAWAGGFLMLWFYAQPWFLDFSVAGVNMRDVFQIQPILLSVAIWVGFLALFGIASDDGVVIATYLDQSFKENRTKTIPEIREAVLEAGMRRIRPCLMTTATTILALLPVLTSNGRGSDVMIPMAIPSFGGMTIALMTLFLVPVLYCMREEWSVRIAGLKKQLL